VKQKSVKQSSWNGLKSNESGSSNRCSQIFTHSFDVSKPVPLLSKYRRDKVLSYSGSLEKLLKHLLLSHFRIRLWVSPGVHKISFLIILWF
jgi:hypothetical protein